MFTWTIPTIVATRVGTVLDRYEIDAELGRGAMGVVYRARDPKLGRTVAIKTVSLAGLEPDAEQEYRKRFVNEAHAAGRLSHPGIVTIFDVREDAEPYLVMEYVEGQSLQQLVSRENCTLPLSTTLRLVQEVAEALHYAHAQGVVHRDIKPANILVTPEGHPKIADFGIAKLSQTDLTLPGQVLGSPAFMAPEQLREENVDSRSDLFSLGVILYYMLTGHRPFQGNSTTTVCFKLVNHEPMPVSALDSKFPPELDAIVSRAIAKDPAQRYQSGAAMAADIQTLREQSGFVHSGDATERSLKRDAIPRYVKGTTAESGSRERKSPATKTARRKFSQQEKVLFSAALVFGLLAIASLAAVFWSTRGSGSKPVESIAESQPPVTEIPNKSELPDIPDNKRADNKGKNSSRISGSRSKRSVSQVKATTSTATRALTAVAQNADAVTAPSDAMLQIEIEHHFTNGTASVWVDDGLVYTQSLAGDKKRRALLFRKVVGHQFQVIPVVPGKHRVRVRIQSAADSYDQSKISSATFAGVSVLRIVCDDKGDGLQLEFKKEGYQ